MNFQKRITHLTDKRGVIPQIPLTQLNPKFVDKLQEELNELKDALQQKGYIDTNELADCFIVICNCATYNNIDIVDAAIEKVTRDVTRK